MDSTTDNNREPRGFFASLVRESTEVESPAAKIYVYEAPVRLWH